MVRKYRSTSVKASGGDRERYYLIATMITSSGLPLLLPGMAEASGKGWLETREHSAFHIDTIADRVR